LSRVAGAAVVGALTGGAALLAGRLMPLAPVPIGCRSTGVAGAAGCALTQLLVGIVLGAFLWLLVMYAVALGVGVLLDWPAGRLAGIRLGIAAPLIWPVLLLAIGIVLRSVDVPR
jgi:hypothetical protein